MKWPGAFLFPEPPTVEVHERPAEFGHEPAADWVIEARIGFLPHGCLWCYRVVLAGGRLVSGWVERGARAQPERKPLPFPEMEVAHLLVVLGRAFPEKFRSVGSTVLDGWPCEMVVYRREPYLGLRATCNLGDWFVSTRRAVPPAVAEIGLVFLEEGCGTFGPDALRKP